MASAILGLVITRIDGPLAVVVPTQLGPPGFDPSAQKGIDRLAGRVANRQNVVNDRHISAALREARGEVVAVRPQDGKPFDHINELKEARNGLMKDVTALKAQLNQGLSEQQGMQVGAALSKASNLLDKVNRVLDKVKQEQDKKICTGTLICK